MVVFLESGCNRAEVVVFGQKLLYSGESGFIPEKVIVIGKMVVLGQKLFFSGKVFVSGQKCLYLGTVVVLGQKWLYSGKSGCIWEKRL